MIEKPRTLTAEILDKLEPAEQEYAKSLLEARVDFINGNETGWKQFARDSNVRAMAKRMREKVEGRQAMQVIYKAVPIKCPEMTVKPNALVVHGEVTIGELNNQE